MEVSKLNHESPRVPLNRDWRLVTVPRTYAWTAHKGLALLTAKSRDRQNWMGGRQLGQRGGGGPNTTVQGDGEVVRDRISCFRPLKEKAEKMIRLRRDRASTLQIFS